MIGLKGLAGLEVRVLDGGFSTRAARSSQPTKPGAYVFHLQGRDTLNAETQTPSDEARCNLDDQETYKPEIPKTLSPESPKS